MITSYRKRLDFEQSIYSFDCVILKPKSGDSSSTGVPTPSITIHLNAWFAHESQA